MVRQVVSLLLLILFLAAPAFAVDAYDGALGHAKGTRHAYTGGNPTIYEITNLNDSGTGSLRACMEATGNRVCIPEVSGRINLVSEIRVTSGNLWVAGQTAPAPGLTLYGGELEINGADDVLLEHIRLMGNPNETRNYDGIFIWHSDDIYLNHVTIVWPEDEAVSIADANNITFDRVLVEGLAGQEGWGMTVGYQPGTCCEGDSQPGRNVTLYKNLYVNTESRGPKVTTNSTVEMINTFWVNIGAGNDGLQIGTKYTSDAGNGAIKVDLIEGATVLGPNSAAADYYAQKYSLGPTTNSKLFVDDWLHTNSMSAASAGRRQTDGAGADWDIVKNADLASGTYQGVAAGVSSGIVADDVDDAWNDVVSSNDTLVDGNVGSRPADRLLLSTQPDYRIINEARVPSTSSHKTSAQITVPSYANNTLNFTAPGSPHVDAGAGYTNLEVTLKTFRDLVEPEDAPGGGEGDPTGGTGDYPTIRGTITTVADTANSLTRNVPMPTVEAEDLILLGVSCDDGGGTGISIGSQAGAFTQLEYSQVGAGAVGVYYLEAVGTEDGVNVVVTTASEKCVAKAWAIDGWDPNAAPESDIATATAATANPPSVTHSLGSARRHLAFAFAGWDNDATGVISDWPDGYTDTSYGVATGAGSANAGWGFLESDDGSEDPTTFTNAESDDNIAITVLIPAPEQPEDPPVTYGCSLTTGECVEDAAGLYETSDCDGTCEPPEPTLYSCESNQCVVAVGGEYSSATCDGDCDITIPSFLVSASVEICGSGIDEASTELQTCPVGYVAAILGGGCDRICEGKADKDRDGYDAADDCDDLNPLIFEGYTRLDANGDWQRCEANGEWTAPDDDTICEATGSGECFYVDPVLGDDTAVGSFAAPKKSLRCFSFDNGCSNGIDLAAGDVVYVKAGTITQTYTSSGTKSVNIRSKTGTANNPIRIVPYPGAWWKVKIDPGCDSTTTCWAVELGTNSYLEMEGFEVTGGYSGGVRIYDAIQPVLRRMLIRNNEGVENDNITGVEVHTPTGGEVSHNFILDNYDRADDGANNTQLSMYLGTGLRSHHNRILLSDAAQSATTNAVGIKYKHSGADGSSTEIDSNIIIQAGLTGIESAQHGSNIHDNLIVDGTRGMRVADLGGPFRPDTFVISNNTLLGTRGFSFGFASADSTGVITLSGNVVKDDQSAAYANDEVLVDVDHYGSNDDFTTFVTGGLLQISANCYYNASQAFDGSIFGHAGSGASGASYTSFAAWQAAGYDVAGSYADPLIDFNNEATLPACLESGVVVPPVPDPTVTTINACSFLGSDGGYWIDSGGYFLGSGE